MDKPNSNKTILHSPHSLEECNKRLTESVGSSFCSFLSSKKVVGRITKKTISIRKKIRYKNSFQTVLRASIETSGEGTKLVVSCGLDPFVKIFLLVWLSGAVVIGGAIFIITLSSLFINKSPIDIGTIMGIIFPPGIVFFGVALLFFGKHLSTGDLNFLIEFLTDLLDAKAMIDVEPNI